MAGAPDQDIQTPDYLAASWLSAVSLLSTPGTLHWAPPTPEVIPTNPGLTLFWSGTNPATLSPRSLSTWTSFHRCLGTPKIMFPSSSQFHTNGGPGLVLHQEFLVGNKISFFGAGIFRVRTGTIYAPHLRKPLGRSGHNHRILGLSTKLSLKDAKTLLPTLVDLKTALPQFGPGLKDILAFPFRQCYQDPLHQPASTAFWALGKSRQNSSVETDNQSKGKEAKKAKLSNTIEQARRHWVNNDSHKYFKVVNTLTPKARPPRPQLRRPGGDISWHQRRNLAGFKNAWLICMQERISLDSTFT